MLLSLVSQKGGVGKSTLAISLAWELMLRGQKVLLADADPQETCLDACARAEQEGRPTPHCVRFGEDLHRVLPGMARLYNWTVVDTPGRIGKVSRAALAVADVALVPVRPSGPDAWALDSTLALIDEAKAAQPRLRAAVVLTQVRRTRLAAKAREAMEAVSLPLFRSHTMNRTAWEWAIYRGMGVTQHEPKGEAANELRSILAELQRFVRRGK